MNVKLAIPLLIQEGWTRHQEEVAKPPLTERTGWSRMEHLLKSAFRNTSSIPTTPSAALRRLRDILLTPQPPLLYQEGNSQPDTHSHLHRPRLQLVRHYLDSLFKEGNGPLSQPTKFASASRRKPVCTCAHTGAADCRAADYRESGLEDALRFDGCHRFRQEE